MKLRNLLFYIAIVQMCTASRCGSGNNDLLTRLYNNAFKSGNPLLKDPDFVYEPLVGSWLVENQRLLIVTKRDEKMLEFRFVGTSLKDDDVTYKALTNKVGNKSYISLLAYGERFMYFKIAPDSAQNIKLMMITDAIRSANPTGTVASYLQKPGIDTLNFWQTVYLQHFTAKERDAYIGKVFAKEVGALETFDTFKEKFPDFGGLDSVKENSIKYTLENTYSLEKLMQYATLYPEITARIRKAAKKRCTTTDWCIDYITYFPNDPAKDSIIDVAFQKNYGYVSDLRKLLNAFPNDTRCAGFDFKIALYEAKKRNAHFYSSYSYEVSAETEKNANIVLYYNSLLRFYKINISKNGFLQSGYVLSGAGQLKIDSLITLVKTMNATHKNITDIYFVLNPDTSYSSDRNQLINFKIAVNRSIMLKKLLAEKLPEIQVHAYPYVETFFPSPKYEHAGKFFPDAGDVSNDKHEPSQTRDKLVVRKVKIEEDGSLRNTELLQESELLDCILEALPAQINLYRSQKPYTRIIPVNFWDEAYKVIQPHFEKYKEKIMDKAAEKGFDITKLQNFVIE